MSSDFWPWSLFARLKANPAAPFFKVPEQLGHVEQHSYVKSRHFTSKFRNESVQIDYVFLPSWGALILQTMRMEKILPTSRLLETKPRLRCWLTNDVHLQNHDTNKVWDFVMWCRGASWFCDVSLTMQDLEHMFEFNSNQEINDGPKLAREERKFGEIRSFVANDKMREFAWPWSSSIWNDECSIVLHETMNHENPFVYIWWLDFDFHETNRKNLPPGDPPINIWT